jgi:chitinase
VLKFDKGYKFKLSNQNQHFVGSPCRSDSTQALGYKEICSLVTQRGWKQVWNEEQQVPYAYKKDQWIGYDDLRSIKIKV